MNVTLSPRSFLDQDLSGFETRHGLFAHVDLQRSFNVINDVVIQAIQSRLRLNDRNAWLQSSKEVGPIVSAVIECRKTRLHQTAQGDRNENLRVGTQCRSFKPVRGDADDRQSL